MEYVDIPSLFDEDEHEAYLKRLSIYATLRNTDYNALLGGNSRKKTARKSGLSLQNLFCSQSQYEPDPQTPCIRESEEACSSDEDVPSSGPSPITVSGADIQDLPVEYTVHGLHPNEKPVIGFYVASEICPGFKYRVRMIGSNQYAFDGTPRTLMSIGMGYGKRLTFKGDKLNENDCVFWSDSLPEGFGFSPVALQGGEKFTMYNDMEQAIATVVIDKVDFPHEELSSTCKNGTVRKLIHARFSCSIDLPHHNHGRRRDIRGLESVVLSGVVELTKGRRDREATVVGVSNVYIPMFGECNLWKE